MNHLHKVLSFAVLIFVVAVATAPGQTSRNSPTSPMLSAVSRDSAISLVIDQVITPSPDTGTLIAFIYDPPGADSTLAAGTDVAPLDSAWITTLASEKWFFWIDLTGDVRFAHPTKFVTVDAATGVVEVTDGEWWPAITPPAEATVYPWESINDRFEDDANRIYGSYIGEVVAPPFIAPAAGRSWVPKSEDRGDGIRYFRMNSVLAGNTCAILVGGRALKKGEENAWQGDIDSMRGAMTTPAPGGGTGMASETQEKNNATKADIQKMLDSAAAHGCNSIIFYYSGHGSARAGGSMLLNGSNLKYTDLATMLNIAGLKFKNVILDNCYGGSALNDFGGKTTTVTITTAADSSKTSVGTLRYYDRDTSGSITPGDTIIGGSGDYTRAWMACWRKLRDSLNRNPTVTEIHNWVRNVNPDSINQKQNPSSTVVYPVFTFNLNINAPGIYQFLGTGVVIDFQNIDAPFDVVVSRIDGPPQGSIDPIEIEIVELSLTSYWQIEQIPPTPFNANVLFQYDPGPGPPIPLEELRLATRPIPSFSNPDPLWTQYPVVDIFTPPPALVALGVTEFSEWTYASTAPPIDSSDVMVNAKWNMVSVPLETAEMHKDTLFPSSVSNAFAYSGGYTSEDILENGRGYWLKFDSSETIRLYGAPIHLDTISVESGWNMVGSIFNPVAVGDVSTIPPGMTLSNFFGYDAGYHTAAVIDPGKAYWVKTSEAGSIILDGLITTTASKAQPQFGGLNKLEIEDARGMKQTLYFGEYRDEFAGVSTEMPPAPPGGNFDARFGAGSWVEFYRGPGAEEYPARVSSARYPLTLRWDISADEHRVIALNGSQGLTGKGTMVLKEEAPITIQVDGSDLPRTFAMSQNYPNPFNPVTRIRYDLPREAHVRLVLFDLLGREVRVLTDGVETAGVKTVELDASTLPTGVYFYKIQTGDFTATRKMMLMK